MQSRIRGWKVQRTRQGYQFSKTIYFIYYRSVVTNDKRSRRQGSPSSKYLQMIHHSSLQRFAPPLIQKHVGPLSHGYTAKCQIFYKSHSTNVECVSMSNIHPLADITSGHIGGHGQWVNSHHHLTGSLNARKVLYDWDQFSGETGSERAQVFPVCFTTRPHSKLLGSCVPSKVV